MDAWLDYSLSDFILFSPEAYWALFGLLNADVWPFQPVAVALLALIAGSAAMRLSWASMAAGVGLGVAWALGAHVFFATHYQTINWAVAWLIPIFWAQAVLLIFLLPKLRFRPAKGAGLLGYCVIFLALAYPLVGLAFGRPIVQSEVAGFAPDPTALFTLGILGLAQPNWRRPILAIIPIVWIGVSIATLLTMEQPIGWLLLAALGLSIALMLLPQTRR